MTYRRPLNSDGFEDKRYPESWNRMRHFRFKQANYICENCGRYAKGDLHLHHLIPLGSGGKNNYENLAVVCSSCHKRIHKEYLEKIGVI